jgi:hypothetical protein
MMLEKLSATLAFAFLVSTAVPASAQWVHYDYQWKCAGPASSTVYRYWVTKTDKPDSARVPAKRITVQLSLAGDRRTKVCENDDHCDWIIEANLACQKSCSRADVVFADDRTLNTEEQCAR